MEIPRWFLTVIFIHAIALTIVAIGAACILMLPQSYKFDATKGTVQYTTFGTSQGIYTYNQNESIPNPGIITFKEAIFKDMSSVSLFVALVFLGFGWAYIYVLVFGLISIFAGMKMFSAHISSKNIDVNV